MKTNQNSNRNRSNKSRRPLNRNRSNPNSSRPSGIKNRIGKINVSSGSVGKPKGDLRQILIKKVDKSSGNKSSTLSNVKSRLGLQSNTAKLEALKAAREQLKAANNKRNPKDIKTNQVKNTISSSKNNQKSDQRNQQTIRKPLNSMQMRRDQLRDNRVSSRRPLDRSAFKSDYRFKNDRLERNQGIKNITTQPIIIPQYIPASPIVYQQATHHSNYDSSSTKYVRRSPINQPEVVTTTGNSVLVTNLSPKITEDEVAELFGDIGPLMNVQIINSTTALVTYFASQHASKAVKVYNYRLLDGIAMGCTILPQTNTSVSTQSPLYSTGRMYSDTMPITRNSIRPNYNLSL